MKLTPAQYRPAWVPQSDDQFTVWSHCVSLGITVMVSEYGGHTMAVPALGLAPSSPFDADLRELATQLRRS